MKCILLYTAVFVSLCLFGKLSAQTDFYDPGEIQEVRIYFDRVDWDQVLDSLYVEGLDHRMPCDVVINGERFNQVGIRYKGFSSVSTNRVKNPFNIDLDYYVDYQNYQGVDKIKLSNVIQDPSFVREVLSYEIARTYMPASRSNWANVYINDTLWGLYTNVEAVDDRLLETHFGTDDHTFFKGNPHDLDLNGENSNLSDNPGTDSTDYYELYTLKSDYGWTDLLRLIDTLNHYPEQIEGILNVDQTLWMHAFNYTLVNFDSYIGYAQNYYLYQDEFGIFQPVVWDLNMSFGSFRFTDASEYFSGFNIAEAKTMDPLAHHTSFSVYPRPLLRNLFANDTYRRMYLAHIRTIVEDYFASQLYYQRAQAMQTTIDAAVAADPNKFYPYADFVTNLDTTTSDLIEYPGIRDLVEARTAYLSTYPGFQGAPTLSNQSANPQVVNIGEALTFNVTVNDADSVLLGYRFTPGAPFLKTPMYDDGAHGDGGAGDGVYGLMLEEVGPIVQYYFYAENDSAGAFSPARAAHEFYEIHPHVQPMDLVINEIQTSPAEPEPWIELFNPSAFDVYVEGMYLSQEAGNLFQWQIPDTLIPAGGYLTVWADGDLGGAGLHTNFYLSGTGGSLTLAYGDGILLDEVAYEEQNEVTSLGRYPNGTGDFTPMFPSFGRKNNFVEGGLFEDDLFVFPNPAQDAFRIQCAFDPPWNLEVIDAEGSIVDTYTATREMLISYDAALLAPGLYLLRATQNDQIATRKVLILK